jgi:hypothetical protein
VAQVEAIDTVLASIDIPGDARVLDVILEVTDMDTGATLTIDVGDAAGPTVPDDNRFIAAFSGQAAGAIRASDSAGLLEGTYLYSTTGEQTIEATVAAAATTGAAGTLTLTVIYARG